MAVKSTVFGSVMLSGSEAQKFRRQVTYGRPKEAAVQSAKCGDKIRAELEKNGYAVIRAHRNA